ncbi:MAG: zf-TFIIB domain-containing protein [Paracoccus sp. (in: a-proteobacteria)]
MKCPVDNETLMMTERNGVEIDYCPKCRGVWLDRGELDKIIERSAGEASAPVRLAEPAREPQPTAHAPQPAAIHEQPRFDPQPRSNDRRYDDRRDDDRRDRRRDYDDDDDYRYGRKPRKRESFLSELFDF